MRLETGAPRYLSLPLNCEEECEESATYQCSAYSVIKHLCVKHSIDFFKPYITLIDHAMHSHFPDDADVEARKIEITRRNIVLYDTRRKIKRARQKVELGLCPVPNCLNQLREIGDYSCIVEQHMRYTSIYRERVLGEDVSDTFSAHNHNVPMTMPSGRVMMVPD